MPKNIILSVNAGSSSIKLGLFSYDQTGVINPMSSAIVTGIGQEHQFLITNDGTNTEKNNISISDHASALVPLMQWITRYKSDITLVGHRLVHGGEKYSEPALINEAVLSDLSELVPLAPDHMPAALVIIRILLHELSESRHVACFDTAFFHAMPDIAKALPLPKKFQANGLRRYGFHGLSYSYLQDEFTAIAGTDARNGRVIYAHLGSGASMAATKHGVVLETTMGATPSSGIMMSTRSGDIDPSIAKYLEDNENLHSTEFHKMVNTQSGLLGVSGLSADMLTLLENQSTDADAAKAIELFVYTAKKAIGSLVAVLGGLDSLIFSGGIGEQSAEIRQRICNDLQYLGIHIDQQANNDNDQLISSTDSKVGVHVIPTDESVVLARQALAASNTHKEIKGGN